MKIHLIFNSYLPLSLQGLLIWIIFLRATKSFHSFSLKRSKERFLISLIVILAMEIIEWLKLIENYSLINLQVPLSISSFGSASSKTASSFLFNRVINEKINLFS